VPVFVAFDVFAVNGRDVRGLPLLRRKARLRRAVPTNAPGCILHADHVDSAGSALFAAIRDHDLGGIVAKWRRGTYAEPSTWIKIKNREYTGAPDRHELMNY
jgi:ATP-dependent DNA ligase